MPHPVDPGQAVGLASVDFEVSAEALREDVPPPDDTLAGVRGRAA